MKTTIKSIIILGSLVFLLTILFNSLSYSQGQTKRGNPAGVKWVDANGDGICDNFVDANGDGINDNPQGYRGGRGQNAGTTKPYGVGRFGDKSGVCDGTGKGRGGMRGNASNKVNVNPKAK